MNEGRRVADTPERLTWRLDSLDRWREEISKRVARCEDGVEGLVNAQRLAAELEHVLRERASARFKTWHKWAAALVGVVTVAGSVSSIVFAALGHP